MSVDPSFDAECRHALVGLLEQSRSLVSLGADADSGHGWRVQPDSIADRERVVLDIAPYFMHQLVSEGERIGTNLPLTQARSMVLDAAGALMGIGALTAVKDDNVRMACVGPLARACAERAATAHWVMSGAGEKDRLCRSLLVELSGISQLLKFLPHVREGGEIFDLEATRSEMLRVARNHFKSVDDKGRTIDGQRLAALTDRVVGASYRHGYAELNAYTHPTGHRYASDAVYAVAESGQLDFVPRSTLHHEGRLCEVAVLCFARALEVIAAYLDAPGLPQVRKWAVDTTTVWGRWCRMNGCG